MIIEESAKNENFVSIRRETIEKLIEHPRFQEFDLSFIGMLVAHEGFQRIHLAQLV